MSGQKKWARHYQDVWQERAGDEHLPKWVRAAALAYGMHKANGHANFGAGDVALVLGKVDRRTGEVVPEPNPGRAVRTAVTHGWLAKGSGLRCLIVPAHAIEGGLGSPIDPCPIHNSKVRR